MQNSAAYDVRHQVGRSFLLDANRKKKQEKGGDKLKRERYIYIEMLYLDINLNIYRYAVDICIIVYTSK